MKGAVIRIEGSKGEAAPGQHETNFRFADALTTADNHVIHKNGIKDMAHQHGCSVTFLAAGDRARSDDRIAAGLSEAPNPDRKVFRDPRRNSGTRIRTPNESLEGVSCAFSWIPKAPVLRELRTHS
jgi:glutamine synthetase-like protein